MSNFVPEKVFSRGLPLHYFNMKKTAAESHRILVEEPEALLDEDCCQTQEELVESLGVTQAAISKRSKAAGYIQKQGNWVPHELKPRDVEILALSRKKYVREDFTHRTQLLSRAQFLKDFVYYLLRNYGDLRNCS